MEETLLAWATPVIEGEREVIKLLVDATKFPEDQLKTVLCMLAAYPFSFLLKSFPNSPTLKHIFNIALGVFFCVYTLGRWSWLHLFFSSLVSYLILLSFSPKVSHKIVFVWAMGYITVRYNINQ